MKRIWQSGCDLSGQGRVKEPNGATACSYAFWESLTQGRFSHICESLDMTHFEMMER